ncbi:fungal-specific transcription factor domain-containing protein [Talaromyces proteolyticus]|uniref:Fungal-specific transcription factor domain-containing protein n=1 Tax=Talaromyces proteolyticus TaxID=1131652 RepID=A0AAD4KUW9_9EURO|nr:fungal-specific transcription factor domain-containing protein [Talaromyces proteolyticus]KAH8697281.1 fungal-specific transcription factor domain-containing protein [Talaromyces proteolyticus]
MSRPQVSIDRITPRRVTAEPRESMNCKSCRKRKIKCNRMRPSCEACKVFQCPCVYDAVPKKRGPKTDVLEALLKRVDGLERRLQEEKGPDTPAPEIATPTGKREMARYSSDDAAATRRNTVTSFQSPAPVPSTDTSGEDISPLSFSDRRSSLAFLSTYNGFDNISGQFRQHQQSPQQTILSDAILDLFFSRIHGKPFHILDESVTRQKHQMGQLPSPLMIAIYAITVRYANPLGGQEGLVRSGLEYALQARREVDADNPTIENLQTLLLLSMGFLAYGFGKKAYMTLSNCSAMVSALGLYREPSPNLNLSQAEKETRRRMFWACYMMDRFATCGSKRPCLISDYSIFLRLPSWSSTPSNGLYVEGEIFNNSGPNIQFMSGTRKKGQGATALLIDIIRILGITSRYLAAGGVKGDSHFPWHSLSNLSKIRQELDIWAAGMQDIFVSIDSLFNHPDGTILLLSKLIYHLIHCLIYRPFLPIDLAELRGSGQHQSWQIEATNFCFLHSNAIAELVEFGRNSPLVEWPAFISYCVCTAGTVHVHGVHYKGLDGEVFSSSSDFLAKEMQQLSWLRHCWTGVQHQREMLQTIYTCHSELVRNLANSTMRFSPVFHLEDFFDRYPGIAVDSSHVRLVDKAADIGSDSASLRQSLDSHSHSLYTTQTMAAPALPPFHLSQSQQHHRQLNNSDFTSSQALHHDPGSLPNTKTPEIPNIRFPTAQHSQIASALFPQSVNSPPPFPSLQSPQIPNAFSPTIGLSPSGFLTESLTAPTPPSNPQYAIFPFDAAQNQPGVSHITAQTPGGRSQTSGSHATVSEGGGPPSEIDPFLSLLEQLAENENSQGGPSELDYFLSGTLDVAPETESAVITPNPDTFGRLITDETQEPAGQVASGLTAPSNQGPGE